EDQQVLQLRQYRLRVIRLRQDAIVFHPPVGIHVGFNHQSIVAHIAERRAERRLLQLRPNVQHQRNVSAARPQFRRQSKEAQQQSEKQHGTDHPRRGRNHESVERILQPHQRPFKSRTPCLRRLARNRHPQLQRQVSRRLLRTETRKQLLRALHPGIFPRALRALFYMAREQTHLRPAHPAVEIRREQLLDLSALHGVTSASLPPREPSCELSRELSRELSLELSLELWRAPVGRSLPANPAATSAGATSPNSGPTSRT